MRPEPKISELAMPFWSAAREHRLVVPGCERCARRFFPPAAVCPGCLSPDWCYVPSPGQGVIYSFSVVERPASPDFPSPYVLAAVDLADGWTMMSNICEVDPADVRIGQPVEVCFEPISEKVTLPMFRPIAADRG